MGPSLAKLAGRNTVLLLRMGYDSLACNQRISSHALRDRCDRPAKRSFASASAAAGTSLANSKYFLFRRRNHGAARRFLHMAFLMTLGIGKAFAHCSGCLVYFLVWGLRVSPD